jgi:hypothetical protein
MQGPASNVGSNLSFGSGGGSSFGSTLAGQAGNIGTVGGGLFDYFLGGDSAEQAPATVSQGFGLLYGDEGDKAKDIASQIQSLAEQRLASTLDPFVIPESTPSFDIQSYTQQSPFGSRLLEELTNPDFNANLTFGQKAFLNDISEQVGGRLGVRELDPTNIALAQALAPSLQKFQSERSGLLQSMAQDESTKALQALLQRSTERAGDTTARLEARGQNIGESSNKYSQGVNSILNLLALDKKDTVVQEGRSTSSGGGGGGGGMSTGQMIGTAATVASAFGWSDRRLKKNIKKIGRLMNGLYVYTFNYIWGGKSQIGVMADEVKKVIPEAVVEVYGYDLVNYTKVIHNG